RADARIARACCGSAPRALLSPAGQLDPWRLRCEQLQRDPAAVDLDEGYALMRPAVRPGRYCCLMRQLFRLLRQQLRLDHTVARRAFDEAGVLEQGTVKAEQRLHASDLELFERTQHPPA